MGTPLGEYQIAAGTGIERRWHEMGELEQRASARQEPRERPVEYLRHHGSVACRRATSRASSTGAHGRQEEHAADRGDVRAAARASARARSGSSGRCCSTRTTTTRASSTARSRSGATRSSARRRARTSTASDRHVGVDRHNNKKEREGDFVDGKKTGPWYEWAGQARDVLGHYTDGKPDGEFVYYDANGNELGRFTITDGTGTMLTFHANKKARRRSTIVKGALRRPVRGAHAARQGVVEGHYSQTMKHGWWQRVDRPSACRRSRSTTSAASSTAPSRSTSTARSRSRRPTRTARPRARTPSIATASRR